MWVAESFDVSAICTMIGLDCNVALFEVSALSRHGEYMKEKRVLTKKEEHTKSVIINNVLAVLFAFITTLVGIICIANPADSQIYYKLFLPISIAVLLCYYVIYFYVNYILSKDIVLECSVLKGSIITFITVLATVIIICVSLRFFSGITIPIAFVSLIVTIMLKQRLGIMSTIMTCFISMIICAPTLIYTDKVDTLIPFIVGLMLSTVVGICMIYLIRSGYSRFKLSWGAIIIAILMAPVSFAVSIVFDGWTSLQGFYFAMYEFLGNIVAIALFTAILPLYEYVFKIWTQFKLAEICSFQTPLLAELKEKASGTFNHSLTVANLSENCAMAIGIDPYMARACAYYHDIGKIKNSQFFVENQEGGYNPHDDLIPEVSAQMIIAHVQDGADILTAHRMPQEIIKTAKEHHGDTIVKYFYDKAKQITEEDLPIANYCYNGPRPTTKYSAIVMLCDICEAITRAKAPDSVQEIEDKVGGVIKEKLLDGQFDNCDLTIKDLNKIKTTICKIVPAILHKRIDYSKAKENR